MRTGLYIVRMSQLSYVRWNEQRDERWKHETLREWGVGPLRCGTGPENTQPTERINTDKRPE